MNVKKKIEQKLVQKNDLIESLGLYVNLFKHDSIQKQREIEEVKKQYKLYELYTSLNPRYSENIIPLKEAKLNVDSSDIIFSSKFNIFRPY